MMDRAFNSKVFLVLFAFLTALPAFSQSNCPSISLSYVSPDEDFLQVNALKIGKHVTSQSLDVYYFQNQPLFPMNQLSEILGFTFTRINERIEISGAQFACDIELLLRDNQQGAFWTEDDFDIYLGVQVLEVLTEGTAQIKESEQLVTIETDREIKPITSIQQVQPGQLFSITPEFEIEDQYHLLTFPTIDLSASGNYINEDSETQYDLATNIYFDSLYHGTEWRVNLNEDSSSQRMKIFKSYRVGAKDDAISHVGYELGDVFTVQDNLVAATNIGQGVYFYTGKKNQFNAFNSISIQETIPPGWRGELYRNGQFIAVQQANTENQLIFNEVPAFFGFNRYELRLFGTEGQTESRFLTYQMGKEQLANNKLNMELYSVSPGKNSIDDDNVPLKGIKSVSKLSAFYGFNQSLTGGLSLHSLTDAETDSSAQYATANIYQQWGPGALSFEASKQLDAGEAYFLGYSGYLAESVNFTIDANYFDDFSSQIKPDTLDLESRVRARFSGSTQFLGGFGWSSSIAKQFTKEGKNQLTGQLSFTKSLTGGAISSVFNYNDQDGFERLFNSLYWVQNLGFATVSAGLEWYPLDGGDLRGSNVELRWDTDSKLFHVSRLTYQPDAPNKYRFNHRVNWKQDEFTLNAGAQVNEDGDWEVNAGFVTSFGYDYVKGRPSFSFRKTSDSGNLHLLSYLDVDRNKRLSKGDRPLSGVTFAGSSDWQKNSTNRYGQALLRASNSSGKQDLSIDLASLNDPFLHPVYEKLSVKTHPGGVNRILLPVVSYSDVEGSVYLKTERGSRPLNRVPVVLKNEQAVVKETITEMDGYFVFSRVEPGNYWVTVADDYLSDNGLFDNTVPEIISVEEQGDVIWLPDLILVNASNTQHNFAPSSNVQNSSVESQSTILTDGFQNNKYIQIGVFKKNRSADVILNRINALSLPTLIKRNTKTGVSFILVGPYQDSAQANGILQSIRRVPTLEKAFIVNEQKFSGSEFLPLESQKATATATDESTNQWLATSDWVCQLASYTESASVPPNLSNDARIIQRQVNGINYSTLFLRFESSLTQQEQKQRCETGKNSVLSGAKGWLRASQAVLKEMY